MVACLPCQGDPISRLATEPSYSTLQMVPRRASTFRKAPGPKRTIPQTGRRTNRHFAFALFVRSYLRSFLLRACPVLRIKSERAQTWGTSKEPRKHISFWRKNYPRPQDSQQLYGICHSELPWNSRGPWFWYSISHHCTLRGVRRRPRIFPWD